MEIASVLSSYSGIHRIHPARLSRHPGRLVWEEGEEEGEAYHYTTLTRSCSAAHLLTDSRTSLRLVSD